MLSRRIFLPTVTAGFLAPRTLLRGAGTCRYTDFNSYSAGLGAFSLNGDSWKPPKLDARPRRLWSKMSVTDRNAVANTLHAVYGKIAEQPGVGGWMGQGWLHHYYCSTLHVHDTAAFLPWHRAFTYFHEQLLCCVDKDFRLPVWDWDNCSEIPSAYENWVNLSKPTSTCALVRGDVPPLIERCLLQSWLLCSSPAEFLGPAAMTGTSGNAYNGPHTLVHSRSGLFMANSETAAFDPLFYSHHANMDRYFCAWREFYRDMDGFAKPQWPADDWSFFDAKQNAVVKVRSDEFANCYLDNTLALGYWYDEPAKIPLFKFDTIPAAPTASLRLNLMALTNFLTKLARAMHVQVDSDSGELMGKLDRLVQSSAQAAERMLKSLVPPGRLMDLFDKTVGTLQNLVLSGRVVVKISGAKVQPGHYYAIGLQSPQDAPGGIPALGGCGAFGHVHGKDWSTPVTICLKQSIFRALVKATTQKGARLVYGDLSQDGQTVVNPQPVAGIASFEIRYPRNLSSLITA